MRSELQAVAVKVAEIPAEELPSLIGELESLKAVAWARLTAPVAAAQSHDELLDIGEAARRLGCSTDYLYRNSKNLSFTRRNGRSLRFSALGIDRHIKQGRQTR